MSGWRRSWELLGYGSRDLLLFYQWQGFGIDGGIRARIKPEQNEQHGRPLPGIQFDDPPAHLDQLWRSAVDVLARPSIISSGLERYQSSRFNGQRLPSTGTVWWDDTISLGQRGYG